LGEVINITKHSHWVWPVCIKLRPLGLFELIRGPEAALEFMESARFNDTPSLLFARQMCIAAMAQRFDPANARQAFICACREAGLID